MYAIIETGGKQLKVEVGDTIFVEKLDVAEGEQVVLDKVLFIGDKTAKIGNPYIKGATVTAKVEKQGKEKKVVIYKYNAKKHYHKKQGHRQPYTKLVINTINSVEQFTDSDCTVTQDEENAGIYFRVNSSKNPKELQVLLQSLVLGLSGVAEGNADYLSITFKEV